MIKTGYSSDEYKEVYRSNKVYVDLEDNVTCIFSGDREAISKDLAYDMASIYPFDVDNRYHLPNSTDSTVTTTLITNPLVERPHIAAQVGLDKMIKYKEHYIVDLQSYDTSKLPENHRRNIKKYAKPSLDEFQICEVVANYSEGVYDAVHSVYKNLIDRHSISGWTAYTKEQIKMLLEVPGSLLFKVSHYSSVFHPPETVNYSLFYIDGPNVYYHLSAQVERGYKTNSNFLMMDTAIKFFKRLGFNKLLLGAVADSSKGDGLKRFKSGFANEVAWNYIIKHVNNQDLYDKLCEGLEDNGFFPLYRRG